MTFLFLGIGFDAEASGCFSFGATSFFALFGFCLLSSISFALVRVSLFSTGL